LLLLMMRVACWQVRLLPCKSFLLTLCCRHSGLLANLDLTDVTNASRTGLMNIHTQTWDTQLATFYGVPLNIMPRFLASGDMLGMLEITSLVGVNITGSMGDQQAALVGHCCTSPGMSKVTMGTSCFILTNMGVRPIMSNFGLISTVAFKFKLEVPPSLVWRCAAGQALDWALLDCMNTDLVRSDMDIPQQLFVSGGLANNDNICQVVATMLDITSNTWE
jgi:glycerol kinase